MKRLRRADLSKKLFLAHDFPVIFTVATLDQGFDICTCYCKSNNFVELYLYFLYCLHSNLLCCEEVIQKHVPLQVICANQISLRCVQGPNGACSLWPCKPCFQFVKLSRALFGYMLRPFSSGIQCSYFN